MAYAGFWKRFAAFLVDTIIQWGLTASVISVVIFAVLALNGINPSNQEEVSLFFDSLGDSDTVLVALFSIILVLVFPIVLSGLYCGIFESSHRQATPGKVLLKIKVTDLHNQRISFARAAGRFTLKCVLGWATLLLSYVVAGMTKKKQAVHDWMIETLVINNKQDTPAVYAGFWKRFAAIMLDAFLIYFVFLIIFMLTKGSDTSIETLLTQPHISWGMQVGLVVTLWLYFAGFESSPTQATPGKMALGIKVTDLNGQRLSFGRATGRHVGKLLSYITFYIGYLMVFLTKKEQGLHDQIAKCLVVNNSPSQAQPSEQEQP